MRVAWPQGVWSAVVGRRCGILAGMGIEGEGVRRHRWEARMEVPLTAAALAFLLAYAWPILEPGLPTLWGQVCRVVSWAAWALFAVDYMARLMLSHQRGEFVRGNLLDLAVVALPLLRPLRLLRLVTLLHVLNRYAGASLRGKVLTYVAGSTVLVLFVASLAVLNAERAAKGATITTYPDALWWAATTVTTVGYGDRYPVTGTGRLVAVGLMLAGIALLGVVTAALASWLVQRVSEVEEASQAATRRDVEALAAEVAALRAALQGIGQDSPGSGASGDR
jgi:voltage-gated potassium channel